MCIRDRVGVVRSGVDDYIMSHGCKPGTELFDMVFDPPVGGRKALLPDHCDAHVSPSSAEFPRMPHATLAYRDGAWHLHACNGVSVSRSNRRQGRERLSV